MVSKQRVVIPCLLAAFSLGGVAQASTPEAERECLIQANFAHEADRRYAEKLAIEAIDESPQLSPTLHVRCSKIDEIAGFARSYEVVDSDMQATFDAERERMANFNTRYRSRVTAPENRYQEYLNLKQLREVVDSWVTEFPKYVEIEKIGKSVQDRDIRAVHVSRFRGEKAPKYRMIILGGHHSREWLAHATTMCITERFIRGIEKKGSRHHKLLSYMTLSVIPMGNPDGFVKTHSGSRMNRKNANGVDLNRNWDIAWGTGSEASASPGADNYPGKGPWSEPESKAYRDFITKYSEGLKGFFDIHAFIPAIMSPYGYKRGRHPKASEYAALMKKMSDAMTGPGMQKYRTGPIHKVVYTASGSSADWVDDKFGAFSFGTEVRGRSFAEPASQIKPSCDENEAAILAFLEEVIPMDGPDPGDDEDEDTSGGDKDSSDSSTDGSKDDSKSSEDDDKSKDSKSSEDSEDSSNSADGDDGDEEDDDEGDEGDEGDESDSDTNNKANDNGKSGGGCRMAAGQSSPLSLIGLSLLLGGLGLRRRR